VYWRYNFLSWLWMAVILILSFLPGKKLPEVAIWHFDKLIHVFFYALLFLFTAFGWKKQTRYPALKNISAAYVIGWCMIYGMLIEVGQELLTHDRNFDWFDVLANGIGSVGGYLFWKKLAKKMLQKANV
jgi:VanZ family protein